MQNRYRLTKKFRFESAHRLDKFYKGKCRNLHGHSWNGHIAVIVEGDLDQYDMAVDYADLGKFTKWLENELDHKTLVFSGDKKLLQYLIENEQAHVLFTENPTCETISKWAYGKAVEHFRSLGLHFVKVESVTIEETCTTSCTFSQS